MRIKCTSVEDFLVNLDRAAVFEQAIYVDYSEEDLSEVSKNLFLHASAVLVFPGGGQGLLQCGVHVGVEREGDGDEVRQARDTLKDQLQEYCNRSTLLLKPGILDF